MIEISKFSFDNSRYLSVIKRQTAVDAAMIGKVAAILEDVRQNGDQALFAYMQKFDQIDYSCRSPKLSDQEIDSALKQVDPEFISAVEAACVNIRRYHEKQLPQNYSLTQADGAQLERRYFPIGSVGISVPSASAALSSSLFMCLVPALVAGVSRVAVISAPHGGQVHPEIVAVAATLGVREIYGISGAQGIAALAFGTKSVPRVDKIVGPGNAWVQTAKKLVYGSVGIDSLAGPSEVVILADESANPKFVAIDLLAQAEHGTGLEAALCFVLTEKKAKEIQAALTQLVADWKLEAAVSSSLSRYGNIFVVNDFDDAIQACETIAPEHIELHCQSPEVIADRLKLFGALFVGPWTPEAAGDYYAGSSHVLPTQGTARFSSGITVGDFMRSSAVVSYSQEALQKSYEKIAVLARHERMRAHELSALLRFRTPHN